MLDCDPHLNDTKELIYELNKTNGLFKFVRIMREKFQEATTQGTVLSFASYLVHCMFDKWHPLKNESQSSLVKLIPVTKEPERNYFTLMAYLDGGGKEAEWRGVE